MVLRCSLQDENLGGSSEGVAADEAASASSAFDGELQRSTASGEVSVGSEE
jgi:hypothetical protein